jgi:hypothetical protein
MNVCHTLLMIAILTTPVNGQVLLETFTNAPDYSNNWMIASQSGLPRVTYSVGNFRVQAPNGCLDASTGIGVTFRSKKTFTGDLDISFQLNHSGWGRTQVGLWSQNTNQPLISEVLDTDDTPYLDLVSGSSSTGYFYSSAGYLNKPITLRIKVMGSNVNFYADNGLGPTLLQTWPLPTSSSPDTYSLYFAVASVCWKSGPNDTSFTLITATAGRPFPTTMLFDTTFLTQNGFLGDIPGTAATYSTLDSTGTQHSYHSFNIIDNTDFFGNPMGMDHALFHLSLASESPGSTLTLSMPSGGDSSDTNSGGSLQFLLPFGITVNAVSVINAAFGDSVSPVAGAFSCAFGVIVGTISDQAFHNVYSGYQLLECLGLDAYLTIQQVGDTCSPVYPIVNNRSAVCLTDPQNHSLYGDKSLNTHQLRKLLWKPSVDGLTRSDLIFHLDQPPTQVLNMIQQKGITVYLNTPRGDFLLDNFH